MGYTYNYKTYYQKKPTSYKDYTPPYTQYKVNMPTSTYKPTEYDDSKGTYAAEIAKRVAEQNQLRRPDAYQSQYTDRISSIADQMGNRKFSYDVNSDALFQQLKSLYNQQGMRAIADTQANAAAMTGGYGNSYGVAASQQAYQQEQNKLLDRIPELQQLALAQYQQEGQDLQNLYAMLSDMDTSEYGKYRDTVSDYLNDRDYLETAIANLRNMDQSIWGQNEQNKYNASNQAWDTALKLASMNDSNFWNAQDVGTNRFGQAQNAYQWANEMTETSKKNAQQAASTDYWNGQNLSLDRDKLNETIRSNKTGENIDWAKVNNAASTGSSSSSSSSGSSSGSTTKKTSSGTTTNTTNKNSDGSEKLGYSGNKNTDAFIKSHGGGKAQKYMKGNKVVDVKADILDKSNGLTLAEREFLLRHYGFIK